jgi:hypothetical protein
MVRILIDPNKVTTTVQTAWKSGLPHLSEEILADCNELCKEDTGALIQSSLIHSRPKEGKLIWRTPYARPQYWRIRTAYKDKNPNATWKWCHEAKARWVERWNRLAQKHFEDNL